MTVDRDLAEVRHGVRRAHRVLDDLGVPRRLPHDPERKSVGLMLAARVLLLELRPPPVPELMGVSEAAQEYGVSPTNLRVIAGLPEPVTTLACGSLWRASEIRAAAAKRRRKRGARNG